MRDEEYVYYQDLKEKKSTGYSARKQRSHCGKGGRVKLPSDYLTKKELKNMSGECKSYRLNEPMKWKEFKAMPDDIQAIYLTALREKYGVSDSQLSKMLGVSQATLYYHLKKRGLNRSGAYSGCEEWDNEGFWAWVSGNPKQEEPAEVVEEVPVIEKVIEEIENTINEVEDTVKKAEEFLNVPTEFAEPVKEGIPCNDTSGKQAEPVLQFKKCIPTTGSMTYEGMTFDILSSISDLLGNAKVLLSVKWDVVED